MKWSKYDLDLRQWCIDNGKPIPGKPEAYYGVDWKANPFFNGIPKEYKKWGSNLQVAVRVDDCSSTEDYWNKVRIAAAKNLDKLVESSNRHRSERVTQPD